MPVYEYHCESCGVFSALRKMSESSQPAVCESCGGMGERILSVPNLAILGKAQRSAHERNEKSAHEPGVRRRSSCGCTGSHTCKPSGGATKEKSAGGNNGLQMQTKKTARPWMLGH
ncbi:putative FmdB family regulatory protein [Methylovorus glucosotrophus]|uniref:FmdB family zinc ribbon protein n=1 Tax=Methylovorus glucosotrophus TaxID=266009 RepID=UPI0013315AE5|nr:zinc ribbon domain-containing protein [Methylovorus glucosotrophus]KAF0844713.1 putative FmdB family regulatory protein [Methylovorus glucosotrophus]